MTPSGSLANHPWKGAGLQTMTLSTRCLFFTSYLYREVFVRISIYLNASHYPYGRYSYPDVEHWHPYKREADIPLIKEKQIYL